MVLAGAQRLGTHSPVQRLSKLTMGRSRSNGKAQLWPQARCPASLGALRLWVCPSALGASTCVLKGRLCGVASPAVPATPRQWSGNAAAALAGTHRGSTGSVNKSQTEASELETATPHPTPRPFQSHRRNHIVTPKPSLTSKEIFSRCSKRLSAV